MNIKQIGSRIQKYRGNAGFSQEQLAEAVNLSTVFISSIERGLRAPNLDNFINIANALQVSADDLLAGEIECGYKSKVSRLSEMLELLPPEGRERALSVMEAMLKP